MSRRTSAIRANPPWSIAVQLTAVAWWQQRQRDLALRCPNDQTHPLLEPFYDGERARLCCVACDHQQDGIPDNVTREYVHQHLEHLGAPDEADSAASC